MTIPTARPGREPPWNSRSPNATDQHDYDAWYDDQFLEIHLTPHPPSLDLLAVEVEGRERKYPPRRV